MRLPHGLVPDSRSRYFCKDALHRAALSAKESEIVAGLAAEQGKPADIGGFYVPNADLLKKWMRPVETFNNVIDSIESVKARKIIVIPAPVLARALLFLERFPTSVDNPLAKGGFKFLSYYVGPNAGISCFGEAKKS